MIPQEDKGDMAVPRFFTEQEPEKEIFIDGENGAHIVKSLRMRPGEKLTLCAQTGKDFFCTITECRPDGALVRVDDVSPTVSEAKTRVTVCQCLPKGDKLETVVQKAVELGAAAIMPVISERCVVRPVEKSMQKKLVRLQKIARDAAGQSGRGIIPEILGPKKLSQALEFAAGQGDVLFFYENARESLKTAIQSCGNNISVFIGPEGGFAPEEAELAEGLGARVLSLGPRILRTETAPIAALSAIFYEKGDMEPRGGESS